MLAMDIIETLSKELETYGEDLTLFEKARYFYLRTCQLFQYDFRYLYGDQETKDKIYYLPINAHQIENFYIICSTWSIIYQQLLNSIGIKSDIHTCGKHQSILFYVDGYELEADATCGADMSRVKMGHATRKYVNRDNSNSYKQILTETDIKLGYLKNVYMDECVKLLANDFRLKYKGENKNLYENSKFNYEALSYKFNWIENLINISTKISGYYDSNYYMGYLISKLLTGWEAEKVFFAPFYQVENGKWDMMSLIKVEQEEKPLYFYLHDVEGKYQITSLEDAQRKHYVKDYSGENKHLFM